MRDESRADNIPGEVDGYPGGLKEVKAEQTLDAAFGREIMADRVHLFDFDAETPEARNPDDRGKDHSAGGGDFNMTGGPGGVEADGQSALNGDHREGSAGVHRELDKQGSRAVNKLGLAENDPRRRVKSEFAHRSDPGGKGRRVSLGERILGILNQDIALAPEGAESFIDLVPVRAVGDESSGDRGGGGAVNLIHGDEQPFAIKFLLNAVNIFRFHILHLSPV